VLQGVGLALGLLVLAGVAFRAGQHLRSAAGGDSGVAYADDAAEPAAGPVTVEYREATIEGEPTGEVVMDGQVVARIRLAAGGLSAKERAMVVAERIRAWLADGGKAEELVAAEVESGGAAVTAGDRIIVTVTAADAAKAGEAALPLAQDWRDNIAVALGGEPTGEVVEVVVVPPAETEEEQVAPEEWVPEEEYTDKIVPILSVLQGVRIGAARVNGPASKVDQVKAVAQLETDFKRILEIDVYVPITTETPGRVLDRVQGVGVTALGDYRL